MLYGNILQHAFGLQEDRGYVTYATGCAAAVVTVTGMSAARAWTHFRDEIFEVADGTTESKYVFSVERSYTADDFVCVDHEEFRGWVGG